MAAVSFTANASVSWRERPKALRWAVYVAVVLVLALIAATVVAVVTVRRSFPQTDGRIDVPGLGSEVRVVRDSFGVPQIYADTSHDLFFAQGYVQAQDRFYEMDVRRHIVSGRLSEMFGDKTLATDKVVRTLGWRQIAEKEYAKLSSSARAYLQAFSDGVNAYIGNRSPGELSLEYTLLEASGLDYQVEKWTPVDSVAWLKAMAWNLRGNMQDEVDRTMASTRLDKKQIAELYPPYPYHRHQPIVPGSGALRAAAVVGQGAPALKARHRPPPGPAVLRALDSVREAVASLPTMLGNGAGIGSNAWAVDGDHSTTGAPILANDPHLAPSLPGIWYQMGLHCNHVSSACPFDVAGFTFAGFPGVMIGHNQQVAWGFTNLGADVSDLYLEAVRGERYRRDHRWVKFGRRQETIDIAGSEPFTFTVRASVHGPLLSDVDPHCASVGANAPVPKGSPRRGGGYAVALSWTGLKPSRTAQSVFEFDAATDWKQFRTATRDFAAPGQNIVYAHRAGHIGYQAPGLVPIRKAPDDGDYPSPGWDPRYDWTGRYVPFRYLPHMFDPKDGFIVTANQAPVGPKYPYDLGDAWDPGYRSQRIIDLLEKKGKLGVADMSEIQLDQSNGFAPTLVPYLLAIEAGSRYYSAGQQLLRDWDYHQPADSPAAAYFNAVWRNLLVDTFDDQLPKSVVVQGDARWFEVMRRLLKNPNDEWWDDTSTSGVREGRDDILLEAIRQARDELVRRQSRRPDNWTWGHIHRLTLENQTVGHSDIGFVRRLVN